MITFSIKTGGFVFAAEVSSEYSSERCRNFLTEEPAEAFFRISAEDIEKERLCSLETAMLEKRPAPAYLPEILEFTALQRKIADYVSTRNAAVFHGPLIEKDGAGIIFTAPSGTGKTTHILNWKKEFPSCRIIDGDKPLLRIEEAAVRGFGTPWNGKEHMGENASAAVRAIVLLQRAAENHIEEISAADALPVLISQIYRAKDSCGVINALGFIGQMTDRVKFFRLGCNMEQSSAAVACRGIFEKIEKV